MTLSGACFCTLPPLPSPLLLPSPFIPPPPARLSRLPSAIANRSQDNNFYHCHWKEFGWAGLAEGLRARGSLGKLTQQNGTVTQWNRGKYENTRTHIPKMSLPLEKDLLRLSTIRLLCNSQFLDLQCLRFHGRDRKLLNETFSKYNFIESFFFRRLIIELVRRDENKITLIPTKPSSNTVVHDFCLLIPC